MGVLAAKQQLEAQFSCKDAVETAVKVVEDYPFYKSVGYGGLQMKKGIVEMDASLLWMEKHLRSVQLRDY